MPPDLYIQEVLETAHVPDTKKHKLIAKKRLSWILLFKDLELLLEANQTHKNTQNVKFC